MWCNDLFMGIGHRPFVFVASPLHLYQHSIRRVTVGDSRVSFDFDHIIRAETPVLLNHQLETLGPGQFP